MSRKMIVFSADALVWEDIAYLRTRPNFSRLMARCAQVERVKSIYPSLTYPCHTTMITGCYPDKHGVLNNNPFRTVSDGANLYLTDFALVQAEDLFTAAKRAGKTTASVYWPVSGNNPNIDYLINEYFFPYNEDVEETFRRFGANDDTIAVVRENADRLPPVPGETPAGQRVQLDNCYEHFMNGCVCSLIRRYQPDLLLVHNCVVDATRHNFGVFGPETFRALDMLDDWLGEIMDAMTDAGVYDDTDFVLISDHGQMDYQKIAHPNTLLREGGYIDVNDAGEVTGWRAFAHSTGMSCIIHMADPTDDALRAELEDFLRTAFQQGKCGLQQVYTEAEVRQRYHMGGDFAFMLENADGYSLRCDWKSPTMITEITRPKAASHGYLPEKGPWPVFLAAGPSFRPGAKLPMAHLVDEAPTLAHVLGDSLPGADGRVLEELLT